MRVVDSLFIIGIILGFSCSILSGSTASSSLLNDPYYGISPQDENYYKTSSDTIKCKDGSNKFTKTQLNDDFCDCSDGTDEPGTSACPNGKFYCRNAGHAPLTIFSSRVNDGICDCCDGSDEYNGIVKCPNTCWEAGKVARDKLKKKIATYQEGVTIRKQEIEKAKLSLDKDEKELSKLQIEEKTLKGLVQQLKEQKEQIEKAEEKERLQREKEERENKEAEEKALREKSESNDEAKQENNDVQEHTSSEKRPDDSTHDDKVKVLEHASKDQDLSKGKAEDDKAAEAEHVATSYNVEKPLHEVEQNADEKIEQFVSPKSEDRSAVVPDAGHVAGSELSHEEAKKVGNDASEQTGDLSREELGRLVASRWTGENSEKVSKEDGAKEKAYEVHEELLDSTHDDEDDGYAPDSDDDTERYDDAGKYDDHTDNDLDESSEDEDHDDTSSSDKSDTDDDLDLSETTSPSWLEKIQQTVQNLLKAVNLFQTPVDKSDADRVRKDYEESSAKLSKLQSRISSLTKKLKHDFGPEKEFYSFYGRCFESKQNKYLYKVCPYKQATQEEGHSSTRLGSWDKFEDSYRAMLFSNGDKCWNGPDRTVKVKLRCGLSEEITDVDEPSRCEYVALLSAPALCFEEKLQELQNKLDLMNKEQPQQHDEL